MSGSRLAPLMVLPGMLFGAGLGVSGMTNPERVQGFLDLAGTWDPTLALVMAGALGSFAPLYALIRKRKAPILGGRMPGPPPAGIDRSVVLGSLLFGIGWGFAGLCPGPAIASIAGLRPEALAFVPAMALGMLMAQWWFGAD